MKAVNHPIDGLILVANDVPTDPAYTYPFEETNPPEVSDGQVLSSGLEFSGGVVRRTWALSNAPLYPVTKLNIKSRVTAQEWAALKAAIALDSDAAENWELAQEIDPAHPQTQQVISYLQSQGQLTTPLWQIFA